MIRAARTPVARPMATLIATVPTKVMTASPGPIGATTTCNAMAKRTRPVPSLRRLSPSTNVDSAGGTRRRLNVATTAAGSVAETIAPTMNARSSRSPVARFRTIATIPAEITTPGIARSARPRNHRRSSANPKPIAGLEHEPGQEHEQDDVGRDGQARDPGRAGGDADREPGDHQGDGVGQSQRARDDRHERGQTQKADQQLDRVRDLRLVHQTVTGMGPRVTRRLGSV